MDYITDINTDIPSRLCTFNVDPDKMDELMTTLEGLGETNTHIEGWSVVQ